MRRTKYIGDTYSSESCLDRFEFLYEHYGNFEEYMRCEKRCFLYMLESMMMYSFGRSTVKSIILKTGKLSSGGYQSAWTEEK